MEQFLNDNGMYTVDLGEVNTAAEIIFELSSILDKEEVKNKRIFLKLGKVILNQAQLLSIKSLINGIGSNLSSIATKSIETEKVALSLGIIVSNISAENITDVAPALPYKTADELKEEIQATQCETKIEDSNEIIEEPILNKEDEKETITEKDNITENSQINTMVESDEQPQILEEQTTKEQNIEVQNQQETNNSSQDEVKDELDIIFGSNLNKSNIFDIDMPKEIYEEKEELTDIIVPEQEYTKEDLELESFPTKYIKQTIRSGQVINFEGNVVIIGDCHPGSEITAFGDITVWGILSGIAHAGAGGNQKARVRALKMNAIQLRIANCYSRRPDSLNTVFVEKTNSFTPEEARIINGEIVVFKIND